MMLAIFLFFKIKQIVNVLLKKIRNTEISYWSFILQRFRCLRIELNYKNEVKKKSTIL